MKVKINPREALQCHRAPGHVACSECGKVIARGKWIFWRGATNERNARLCVACLEGWLEHNAVNATMIINEKR